MPVEWRFAQDVIQLGGTGVHKITAADGARQQETARSILTDLAQQPGVVLADEVGMGKTYVALAVAASVLLATRRSTKPVIIMMPPGLAGKWKREWEQFKSLCCTRPEALTWVREAHPAPPTEFFKLLDDPPARRKHLIWMTTNCFSFGLSDPWIKLAMIRLARSRTRMDEGTKRRLYRWAKDLVRLKSYRDLTQDLMETLLQAELPRWSRILMKEGILGGEEDDPVPEHLLQHQNEIDWSRLAAVLRGEAIPRRRGVSDRRIKEARGDFNEACKDVYRQWLAKAKWQASLLILDEAHHAKNDGTQLAKLFRSADTEQLLARDEETGEQPLLWDKFDRMLFLTATPFQLGHHELIRVLRSFAAARWSGVAAPRGTREEFNAAIAQLEKRLDASRLASRRLDRLWGRLNRETFKGAVENGDLSQQIARWWQEVCLGTEDPFEKELLQAVQECQCTKAKAENDSDAPWGALQTWIIRHNRPLTLPQKEGTPPTLRRDPRPGAAIEQDEEAPLQRTVGLPLNGETALPFLLAARAQGELATGSAKARAFFAEGLCSSYEAFHHTKGARTDVRDVSDDGVEIEISGSMSQQSMEVRGIIPMSWYEEHIEKLIPSKTASEEERYRHPKMHAVVKRVVQLWLTGEKVLVFCFYRETARALRDHIRREVSRATVEVAAKKLGLDPVHEAEEVQNWFTRISRRFTDRESPFSRTLRSLLYESISLPEFAILAPRMNELVELLAAYVRSSSFVARYLPLEVPEVREALAEGENRPHIVHAGVEAFSHALTERADGSAMTMRQRIEEFLRFAADEAERSPKSFQQVEGEEYTDPLTDYLRAIAIYVSPRQDEEEEEKEEPQSSFVEGAYRVLSPVRMVYGATPRAARNRLMLAFNSPLFPEILISSSVLSEGVDLHRFCRYVIHHDLCWNPSTLEQRTGRLDRIRCKAEITHRPIVVYEPFLAGSADEKMFRVVCDRERWFQIVMGQKFEFDEATSEQLADRVPLPENLARELTFDLRRVTQ